MLAQVFLNWNGSGEEFARVKSIVRDEVARTEGITLEGLYIPSNKWNYVVIYKIDTFENFIKFQKGLRTQIKTQGLAKIPTRKLILMIKEKDMGQ